MSDNGLSDISYMRLALRMARKAYGCTSPNPLVGAVLVKNRAVIGQGWHHQAGLPHAEIEAIADARKNQKDVKGATLYVTLEPCSTHGRTPPCTGAIIAAGIRRVVVAATDPNPVHAGKGYQLLTQNGVEVVQGVLAQESARMNEAFNYWIVSRIPYVVLKSAMSLDGKIATKAGESQWITGPKARAFGMKLRLGADAILVGIGTILADDPSLTVRSKSGKPLKNKKLHRFILDSEARTPLSSNVVCDQSAPTTIVTTYRAPIKKIRALEKAARVWMAPEDQKTINLNWLLKEMGRENITSLLVEGGGFVHESFFAQKLVHRIHFIFAPKVIGGKEAARSVSGIGSCQIGEYGSLKRMESQRLGADLMLSALVAW